MSTPGISGSHNVYSGPSTGQGSVSDPAMRQRLDRALQQVASEVQTIQRPQMEELVKPVQRINQVMKAYGIEFDLSESGSRVITRIVEVDSGEVIRQIPSEAVLRVSERLDELVGVLLQDQA